MKRTPLAGPGSYAGVLPLDAVCYQIVCYMAHCGAYLRWLAAFALVASLPVAHAGDAAQASGQQLAHDVYKGNCLGCHQIPGDPTAVSLANIGPPLTHMRERFPDRAVLRSQIWDSTARNPETVMPPFGRHKILTDREIDRIVDYLYQY